MLEIAPKMVKDRLNELQEKSEFKDWEDALVQEHEFKILRNQKQILQDLKQFSEISSWIDELQQNILDIEVELFGDEHDIGDTGSIKASQRLDDNANLCFKIFSAVKRLQEDLDKLKQQQDDDTEEEQGLVNLVRNTQFDNIKTAYLEAYWKYNAVVRRYEDEIKDKSSIASSHEELNTQPSPCDDDNDDNDVKDTTSDPMLANQDSPDDPDRSHSLQSFAIVDETRDTLDAAVDRHQELVSLERSLIEMRDLFVLISTLVMSHDSILNLVEGNGQVASEYVAKAPEDIKEARKYYTQTSSYKWLCFDMTHCLFLVMVMLIAIATYMAVKKFLL